MGKALDGRKLPKGITQRKDGLYQARFVNEFGKTVTLYNRDLAKLKKEFNDAKKSSDYDLKEQITLDEWFERWRSVYKQGVRNTTYMSYERTYNLVKDSIGHKKLIDINNFLLQSVFNNLASDATREKVRKLLSDMFKYAMICNLINCNPTIGLRIKLDNTPTTERRVLTKYETKLFLENAKKTKYYNFFTILVETGLRQGELSALHWSDVDLEEGTLEVTGTYVYYHTPDGLISEIHPPKTDAGRRTVPLTKNAIEAFKREKQNYKEINDEFGDLVFRSLRGEPVKEASLVKSIKFILKDLDIEYFTPHSLRHTFSSRCIESGINPKTLQKYLGHSSIDISMNLYTHVMRDTLLTEIEKLETV